jgi:rod shape determining protein RodA
VEIVKLDGLFGEAVDRIGGEPVSSRMARRAPIRHLDPALLLATLLLSAFGVLMVFSATVHKQEAAGLDPNAFMERQIIFAIVGAGLLIAMSMFDYRHLRAFAPVSYAIALMGLVLVLTPLGDVRGGASRWINLGAFQAQPSELAKLAVLVGMAAFLAERKGDVRARDVAAVCGIAMLPMILIYLQPDLGTTLVFVILLSVSLLIGGAKLGHFAALALIGLIAIVTVIQLGMLEEYQIERVTAFLDASPDVQSEGYNLTQSKIAIASGGMQGKGLRAENTQTSLDFVPEQHTDFIFTAVGEQLGFVGSATLLGLFVLLIWRALRIATMSRDMFGTLIAGGIAAYWVFQVFVNVGMTMGIMPITGIPLPFISYGGSSLLTNFLCVGLLLNIHMRRYV